MRRRLAERQGRRLTDGAARTRRRGRGAWSRPVARRRARRRHRREGGVPASCSHRGLIVNAVNASTLRLVPPITVTDDEIDEAVGLIGDVLALALHADARRTGRPRDPPPARRHRLRRRRDRTDPGVGCRTDRLARPSARRVGRGADLREAVEPDPPLHGDGRRAARRPSDLHARRGGRLRHPRSRSRTSRGSWPATTP